MHGRFKKLSEVTKGFPQSKATMDRPGSICFLRTSLLAISIFVTAVLPETARALDFWRTIGMCAVGVEPSELPDRLEPLGWLSDAPTAERFESHSAMFNLQYHIVWMGETDAAIIAQIGRLDELDRPAKPEYWDQTFTSTNHDAVLTFMMRGNEKLCFMTANGAPFRHEKRTGGNRSVRQFQLGDSIKNNTLIVLYNQGSVAHATEEEFGEQIYLPYPFVAKVSHVDGEAQ